MRPDPVVADRPLGLLKISKTKRRPLVGRHALLVDEPRRRPQCLCISRRFEYDFTTLGPMKKVRSSSALATACCHSIHSSALTLAAIRCRSPPNIGYSGVKATI